MKIGDLVAHTMDSGPPGVGLVVELSKIRPGWAMCKFICRDQAWWYPMSVLHIKGYREKK